MSFEELQQAYIKMQNTWALIPKTYDCGDFASEELAQYHNATSEFLKLGQEYFDKKDVSMDELMELYNNEAIQYSSEENKSIKK